MFVAYAWSSAITKANYPEVVRIGPNNDILSSAFAPFMTKQHYRHVAVVAEDTAFGQGLGEAIRATATLAGIDMSEQTYQRDTHDLRPTLKKVLPAKPDAIVVAAHEAPGALPGRLAGARSRLQGRHRARLGLRRRRLLEGHRQARRRRHLAHLLGAGAGDFTSAGQTFTRLFTKKYKHAPLVYQAFTWDELNAWKWAVETAGSVAPADVIPVLPRIDMQGTLGHITLSNKPGTVHFNQWDGVTVYFDQATKKGATDSTAKLIARIKGQSPVGSRPMPHRSLWLDEALSPDEPAAPPLEGAARADVAIMGGGYAGLWTAIRIKQREPSCDVVVLEQDICGGGASGRNGGFAISWWAKLGTLVQLCGAEGALALARACEAGRRRDRRVLRASTASTRSTTAAATSGRPRRRPSPAPGTACMATCRELGVMPFEEWTTEETVRRSGTDRHLAGLFEPSAAIVQPARLVRGLRRVALELGVRIHEGTRVTKLDRRSPAVLHTPRGVVTADRVVVATNAWAVGPARAAHAPRDHLERHRRDRADARPAAGDRLDAATSASATRG